MVTILFKFILIKAVLNVLSFDSYICTNYKVASYMNFRIVIQFEFFMYFNLRGKKYIRIFC